METHETELDRARKGPVVLLVEDNAAMRTLIKQLVGTVAPVVHECGDGLRALDDYLRLRPDWVLMDIDLGSADGLVVTRAIRKADPAARVIIVTEHGDEAYRREARAVGATGFVLKENLLELPGLLAASHATTETER